MEKENPEDPISGGYGGDRARTEMSGTEQDQSKELCVTSRNG